jgi:hypothetical protein
MKLLIVLAPLLALANSQCAQELITEAQCLVSAALELKKDAPDVDHEQIETDISNCFIDNGCSDPKEVMKDRWGGSGGDDSGDDSGTPGDFPPLPPGGGPPPPPGAGPPPFGRGRGAEPRDGRGGGNGLGRFFQALQLTGDQIPQLMQALEKCGQQHVQNIKPKLEQCIGEDPLLQGFTFVDFKEMLGDAAPPPPPPMGPGGPGGHGGPTGKAGLLNMLTHFDALMGCRFDPVMKTMMAMQLAQSVYDTDVCPESSRTTVQSCITNVVNGVIPDDMKCQTPFDVAFDIASKKDQMCQAWDACYSTFSQDCLDKKDELPDIVCGCIETMVEDDFDQAFQDLTSCLESNLDFELPAQFQSMAPAFQKMTQAQIQMTCSKPFQMGDFDPCKSGPPPFMRGPGGPH